MMTQCHFVSCRADDDRWRAHCPLKDDLLSSHDNVAVGTRERSPHARRPFFTRSRWALASFPSC
jgi:hypothetical protein